MRLDIHRRAKGLRSRFLRVGVALLMSALLPAQAVTFAAPGTQSLKVGKPGASKAAATSRWATGDTQDLSAKIDPAVQAAFTKGKGQVTYLVKLRTRADVKSAAESARAGATPAQAMLKARSAVISNLKETAEATQAGLLSDLEKARASGQVARMKPYWVANMVAVTSTKAVMERIAKRHDVEKIYPNSEIHLVGGKKTQAQTAQVSPSGSNGVNATEWNIDRVGAPLVWDQFGIDGTGVVVASLDTGVQFDHPALANQYAGLDPATGQVDHTFSWFDPVGGQTTPYDDHGHGTHTTGTMVGRDPDGVNEIGVAPGARWIAAKIFSAQGSGSAENILAAGEWVLAPGGDPSKAPDAVNNSWGGGPGMDEWFLDIVQAWRAAGIVPVFAAGNDGPGPGTVSTPGNYPDSFAVGATDSNDGLASFSSRGPSPYGEIKPEVSAPGVNIRSAVPGSGYESGWNGTSMATPHVTGAVALLRQADASLTVDEIELILMQSADPITNAQYPDVPNNGYGHGILNTYTAVAMVASGIGSVSGRVITGGDDLIPPTITHTPVEEAFKHTDTTIVAQIADNVSITNVYLRFRQPGMRWWGIVDMGRVAGDHKNGTYSGVIPADIASSDIIEYYIEAVDYGNNHAYHGSRRYPHQITMLNGITPGYLQDFEGSYPGWQISGTPEGVWEIGEPTSGPGAAYSGTKVAATKLGSNYPDNATSFLISPPIDLTGGPAALRFMHWYQLEENWDYGIVAVTVDGGQNWEIMGEYTGANGAYEEGVVDLTAYAGNPAVFVAWVLLSDSIINEAGWYIDDVELYQDDQPPAAPTNLTAEPTAVGSIALAWDSVPAGDLAHYTVYRSETSGGASTAIGQTSATSFVDPNPAPGTTYYYVVTATDSFGNEGAASNEASATAADVTTLFFDDMEGGPGAWTHTGTNDPWEWGVPIYGPSSAASGMNVWATMLADDYADGTDASLMTPPIDLSGLSSVSLQFAHWYSIERNFDFGRVEISADGGANWTQLAQYTAPGGGGQPVGWEYPLVDLSGYAGQTVQLRFRLTSDSSIAYAGWYIDDVRIAGTASGGSRLDRSLSVKADAQPTKKGQKPTAPASIKMELKKGQGRTYKLDKSTGMGGVTTTSAGIMSLPVDASVTVVETGRVVRTNPADGSYQITLPAGTYTLRAEAYGYYPSEQQVEIIDGMEITAHFILEPMPRGMITGTVISQNGGPIEGARVWVAEDPMIAEMTTDSGGHFALDVLAGSYTIEVRHPSFYPASMPVDVPAEESVSVFIEMEPFIGMPGEIGYDDGSPDNAWAYYAAGNGWAVRMTPEHPGQTAFVSAARIYLWDASWPAPGGNSFRAAIFAANSDGSPGALLAGPVTVNDAVRGAWNDVDFSGAGVAVTGDFYVAFIQDKDYPDTPGLAFDESTDQGRTWSYVSGSWAPWDQGGNAMIRAVVNYAVGAPVITAPADGSFTNSPDITVEGTGVADTIVSLYVDDQFAVETIPDADGNFAASVTLTEGEHVLTATATVPGDQPGSGTTDPSAPVHVIVDLTAPELTVTDPEEGATLNSRLLSISGLVADAHLAGVTVNGWAAEVAPDGQFTVEIIGREGENLITVVANDLAGNETTVTRTVHVDSVAPVLSNLQPATDQNLTPGDTLTVSFDSDPGLALAAFKIVLDGTAGSGGASDTNEVANFNLEPGEMAMTEVSPGHYEATWTVPAGMSASSAFVEFRAVDPAGNTTRQTAPGVLHITNPDQQTRPRAKIQGPTEAKVRQWLRYDGKSSVAPKDIVTYSWKMGDGKTYSGPSVRHSYRLPGTYKVTLTVTDRTGATDTTTIEVVVTRR
ncbi:MAG: S8 family serine peptidase [Bacillota bacterium]